MHPADDIDLMDYATDAKLVASLLAMGFTWSNEGSTRSMLIKLLAGRLVVSVHALGGGESLLNFPMDNDLILYVVRTNGSTAKSYRSTQTTVPLPASAAVTYLRKLLPRLRRPSGLMNHSTLIYTAFYATCTLSNRYAKA